MEPRILFRTHYQAEEPRLIVAATTHCTTPTKASQEDSVVTCLVNWARGNSGDLKLSKPGATYAVGNAREIGLLDDSFRWTHKALAFGFASTQTAEIVRQNRLEFSPFETNLYLKYFFLASGAVILAFGRWLLEKRETRDQAIAKESVLENVVLSVLTDYLALASDIRDRTRIRAERDRLERTSYASATKRHKRYPLLRTLERLDLISVDRSTDDARIMPDAHGRLRKLVANFPSVRVLEEAVAASGIKVLLPKLDPIQTPKVPHTSIGSFVLDAYRYAMNTGQQACSLDYLEDAAWAGWQAYSSDGQVRRLLESAHQRYPRNVRFHVDRQGKRAFIFLDEVAAAALADGFE